MQDDGRSDDDWLADALALGSAGAWCWDMRTDSVRWSDGLLQTLAIPSPPASYAEFLSILHPSDRQQIDQAVHEALSSGAGYRAEFRVSGADGRLRWFEDRGAVQLGADGRPFRMVGIVYEVTERHVAQEEVAEGRERRSEVLRRHNAALAELSHSCVWQGEAGERVLQLMARIGAETLGVARVSIWLLDRAQQRLVLQALNSDDWPREGEAHAVLSATNRAYFDALVSDRAVRADDALADPRTAAFAADYLLPLSIGAKLDAAIVSAGREAGVVCFEHLGGRRCWTEEEAAFAASIADFAALAMALTERKAVEAQLLHAQKMESIGRLAGGVAHDFNNLLTAIIGGAELAAMCEQDREPTAPYLSEIREAATRAADLTSRLLAFARKQVVAPRLLDVNEVVLDAAKVVERLIGEDIEFRTRLQEPLWKVRADPSQLHQIILNLAVNARDAMDAGGSLQILTTCIQVDQAEAARRPGLEVGEYVRLSVIDTGTGIGADLMPHLFEPFFTTKELGKGTGLGLATCYGIVSQAGGHIYAESRPGRGTAMHVLLPRHDAPVDLLRESDLRTGEVRGDEVVLLVEDDERVRRMARHALESYGYRVRPAANGAEALAIAGETGSDLSMLVTDLVMTDMSGRDVATLISELRPELPVLYMSGYSDGHVVRDGLRETQIDFLPKPFTPYALASRVRAILDRYRGSLQTH